MRVASATATSRPPGRDHRQQSNAQHPSQVIILAVSRRRRPWRARVLRNLPAGASLASVVCVGCAAVAREVVPVTRSRQSKGVERCVKP